MRKYRKPIIREVILDSEVDILAGSLINSGENTSPGGNDTDQEDYSKGGFGSWEED